MDTAGVPFDGIRITRTSYGVSVDLLLNGEPMLRLSDVPMAVGENLDISGVAGTAPYTLT